MSLAQLDIEPAKPIDRPKRNPLSMIFSSGRPPRDAEFERLLATVEAVLVDENTGRFVVFSSVQAGEGKTTVLAATARYLARTGKARILVVDASSRGDVARRLGSSLDLDLADLIAKLAAARGTSASLRGTSGVVVARPSTANLHDAAALFTPDAMAVLGEHFDQVLIEFPPFNEWPGVVTKSILLGGLVCIVEAGRTRWPLVQEMREQFEEAGGKVLGVVLNKRRFRMPKWIGRWL